MCTCTPAASSPASAGARERLQSLLGRQAELRPLVRGADRRVRVGLDARRDPHQDPPHTGFCRALDLVEGVDDDEAGARTRGGRQLFVALVVPVHDEPLPGEPGKQRELELAQGRDVRAQPSAASSLRTAAFGNALTP